MSVDVVPEESAESAEALNRATNGDRLDRLPDEILLQLFEALGRISKHDLCSVSRLNKRYHRLSDAVLYKSALFETPDLHQIGRAHV